MDSRTGERRTVIAHGATDEASRQDAAAADSLDPHLSSQWAGWLVGLLVYSGALIAGLYFFYLMVLHEKEGFKGFCIDPGDMRKYTCFFSVGMFSFGIISLGQINVSLFFIGQVGVGLLGAFGQANVGIGPGVGQICFQGYVRAAQLGIGLFKCSCAQLGISILDPLKGGKILNTCADACSDSSTPTRITIRHRGHVVRHSRF